MNHIKAGSQEHKRKLDGLCNACKEGTECRRCQKAVSDLLLLRFCRVIHSQTCCRKSEHHEGEETCHVHTGLSQNAGIPPEIAQVVDTGHVKPEHGVEGMVKTEGNQQTVEECVDSRAQSAHTDKCHTHSYQ